MNADGLEIPGSLPILDGRITLTSNYYQDTVDTLRAKYDQLEIVTEGKPAIRFEDEEVLRVLCTEKCHADDNGSSLGTFRLIDTDGDGMLLQDEVDKVRSLSNRADRNNSIFQNNTKIVRFNEFARFTNLNKINSNTFDGCTNLTSVMLPAGPTYIGGNVFSNCTSLERLVIPEGYLVTERNLCEKCYSLTLLDLPSTLQTMGDGALFDLNNNVTVVCRAVTPPSFGTFNNNPLALYVPDESVDAYKSANGWSQYAKYIKPLSEYEG